MDPLMALLELFKIRMTLHILITTLIGFYIGSGPDPDWGALGWTLLGTGLMAVSAFCFNQAMEKDFDSVMIRTQKRPLPRERIGLRTAYAAGAITGLAGTLLLWKLANPLTAILGVATVALYAGVYTPMKRLTTLNTLVGAVPGALPPLMGWTAAQNSIGIGGLLLFALLFCWQLPHFLALAWMYRDDYRRGGFKMLSLVDGSGITCFRQIRIQTFFLLIISFLPYGYGLAGGIYLITATAAGLLMLWTAYQLGRSGTREAAVRLFLLSLVYLPTVLIVMAVDKRFL